MNKKYNRISQMKLILIILSVYYSFAVTVALEPDFIQKPLIGNFLNLGLIMSITIIIASFLLTSFIKKQTKQKHKVTVPPHNRCA